MRCYNCGVENPENSNYCLNCGVSLKYMLLPERRIVCVMFVDLVNFTRISENRDPEDVLTLLNTLFTRIEKIVVNHDGTIDKYLGDGVMILFGTPIAHEDDVERALRCSLDILQDVRNSNLYLNENIEIKISLNVGPVICGFTGGTQKRMYTVIGDDVNVAEKINDFARPNSIVVTEKIVEYGAHTFEFKKAGEFKIQGKEEPLRLFELIGLKPREVVYSSFKGKLVPLVGRKEEFNKIISGIKRTIGGSGSSIVLIGEAGVGKSRMKYEAKKYCKESYDFFIAEANCRSYYQESLYQPLIEILTQIFNINLGEELETKSEKINQMSKYYELDDKILLPFKNILGVDISNVVKEKLDLEDAFIMLLEKISHKKPVLLIFEDIQWIDDGTLEILRNLIKRINNLKVYMLLTYRPARRIPLPDIPNLETITLSNLSKEETFLLVSELLEVEYVPESFVELIYKKTEGNPLFIEELVERLYKDGVFILNDRREIVITKNLGEITIPDKITSLFLQEIDRLPPQSKTVIKVASVIGRDFNKEILQALFPIEDVDYHLKFLEDFGLVFRDREKENRYFFKHSFVREAVYSLLPKKEQRELHYKVAEAIEKIFEDRLVDYFEVLSYHYEIAEGYDKSFYYNLSCGKNYVKAGMYAAARNKLKKAEEMLNKLSKVDNKSSNKYSQFDLYYELAKVSLKMGFLKECVEYCEVANNIALSLEDRERTMASLQILIEVYMLMGDYEALLEQINNIRNYFGKETAFLLEEIARFILSKTYSDESTLTGVLESIKNIPDSLKVSILDSLLNSFSFVKEKSLFKKILDFIQDPSFNKEPLTYQELEILKIQALLLAGNYSDAQSEFENIKLKDKKDLSDVHQIRLLILESRLKREQGEFADAQQLLSLARSMAEDSSNLFLKAKALFELGKIGFFYTNEYVSGLKNFSSAVDSYTTIGEIRERELCKMFTWLGNIVMGNMILYENLPQQIRIDTSANLGILINDIATLQVVSELLNGNFENVLTRLTGLNLNHVESELLVMLAYTTLLFLFLKEINLFKITVEKILFLLSKRNYQLFENAHYDIISAIYHGIIKKDSSWLQKILFYKQSSPALLIRETRILLDAVSLSLEGLLSPDEKLFYFEDLSAQAEILKSAFVSLLVEFVKKSTVLDPEILSQTQDNIEKMLKMYKFNNVMMFLNS